MAFEDKKLKLKITDLNDDCLIEIVKNLNSNDLISLYQANSRFTNAIEIVVPKITFKIEINADLEKTEKFSKKFGDRIKILYVENENGLVKLIKYFNGGNVKSCELVRLHGVIDEEFIEQNFVFFKMLQSLKLVGLFIVSSVYEKLFDVIAEIKTLTLIRVKFSFLLTNADVLTKIISFRHLKILEMNACTFGHGRDYFALPAGTSTTVNELKLGLEWLDMSILNHFPNVNSLNLILPWFIFNYEPLNMSNLKTLSLSCGEGIHLPELIFSTFAECNSLERLDLEVQNWNVFACVFRNILEIGNLKELNLNIRRSSFINLMDIVHNFKQFQSFSIRGPDMINEEILCQLIQLLPDLDFVCVAASAPYQSLYDRLADIRKNQSSRHILYVEVLNYHDRRAAPVFIQDNKWVKMRVLNGN